MKTRIEFRASAVIFSIIALSCSAGISHAEGHGQDKKKTKDDSGPIILSINEVRDAKPVVPVAPMARPTGSLFSDVAQSLYSDARALRAGDTITVLVTETSTATASANTKSSRADSANLNSGTGLLKGLLRSMGGSSQSSIDGQGQTNRAGSLTTRITVLVKDVLPNGNLSIEGSRSMMVNKETQKVVLSGIVRPQDIGPDNTVSSIQIANATISFDGRGTVGDRQRKGLIATVLGFIF